MKIKIPVRKTEFHQNVGSTKEERREETNRILDILADYSDSFSSKEIDFLAKCSDLETEITPKMLFWLRDIKDKYL